VAVVSLTAFCGQIRPRPTGGFRQRRIWRGLGYRRLFTHAAVENKRR